MKRQRSVFASTPSRVRVCAHNTSDSGASGRSNKFLHTYAERSKCWKSFVLENARIFMSTFLRIENFKFWFYFSFPWHSQFHFPVLRLTLSLSVVHLIWLNHSHHNSVEWIVKLCIISVQFLFSILPHRVCEWFDAWIRFDWIENSRTRVYCTLYLKCKYCAASWHEAWATPAAPAIKWRILLSNATIPSRSCSSSPQFQCDIQDVVQSNTRALLVHRLGYPELDVSTMPFRCVRHSIYSGFSFSIFFGYNYFVVIIFAISTRSKKTFLSIAMRSFSLLVAGFFSLPILLVSLLRCYLFIIMHRFDG